jgi:hypothetical protein
LRRRIGRARTIRIVGDFRGELGQDDVQEPEVEGGRPAHRKGPVDELWAFCRHDHVAGAKVAMAKPVAGRQAIDQREDIGSDVLRNLPIVESQLVLHIVAHGEDLRRRWRLVNGHGKSRDDRARLFECHRAGPREMPQGRPVEALQHDAEAHVQCHLAEHLRHPEAGDTHGADHAHLVPAEQMRDAGLEQLHDLTGRPGVGFGEGAFTDLFPSDPCMPVLRRAEETPAASKKKPLPSRGRTF